MAGQWPTHVRYEEDEGEEREKGDGKEWGKVEEEWEKDEGKSREKDKGKEWEKEEG